MAGHLTEAHEMSDKDRQYKYEVEEAVRSLTKAEEVKKNKNLYDEACKMMEEQKKMMDSAMSGK